MRLRFQYEMADITSIITGIIISKGNGTILNQNIIIHGIIM